MELGFYLGLCIFKDLSSAPLFLCWMLELIWWGTPLPPLYLYPAGISSSLCPA